MDESVVLRTAKVGGFVKEDVLQYVDELNSKNVALEEQIKSLQEVGPADPQEINDYKQKIEKLQEKFNTSNNSLRAATAELDSAKKQREQDQHMISQLKDQVAKSSGSANAVAELNNVKSELSKAKSEIDRLKNIAATAEQKAAAALKNAGSQQAKSAADTSAKDAEISKLSSALNAAKNDLNEKTKLIDEKEKEIADKKNEISKLNDDIAELKENAESSIAPSFDMGALFTEAQKTAKKITIEARNAADKMTKDAAAESKQIIDNANAEATKTIESANTTAQTCIKEANEQAKMTVLEANLRADKVNEIAATVKNLLSNEIESVNTKFTDVSNLMKKLTSQANDRMNEAQLIITEARSVVNSTDDKTVQKANVPDSASMNEKVSSNFEKNIKDERFNPKPAQNPDQMNKNMPHQDKQSKKAANFNFDMSELLKAAEEEAANTPEEQN